MRRHLRWLGHVARVNRPCILKCLLVCRQVSDKRSVGRAEEEMECLGDGEICGIKCDLVSDWWRFVKDFRTWWGLVWVWSKELSDELEDSEKSQRKKNGNRGAS